jgi:hypothetical protein
MEEIKARFDSGDEVAIGPQGREPARYRFNYNNDVVFIVEGLIVRTFKELEQLTSQDRYRKKISLRHHCYLQ